MITTLRMRVAAFTAVIRDVMPCNLVDEDGGSMFLQTVGNHLPDYTASQSHLMSLKLLCE